MSAGAVRQGKVFVEIGADPKKLFAALASINKRIGMIGTSMTNVGRQMMALGAGIATPILGAAAAFSLVGDAVQKMAARTGLSTQAVSALGFAAEQSGTDMGTLEKGVRTMQRSLDDAINVGGQAAESFKRLGLNINDLKNMSPEDQFLAIADALSQIEDPGERAALAMKIFGRAGTALLPMLAGGATGIRALMRQAEELGIVMDQETADSAARLHDSMNELRTAMKAIAVTVGAAVAPALAGASSAFARIAGDVSRFVSANREMVQRALGMGAAIFALGGALTGAGLALKVVSAGMAGLISPLASTIKMVYRLAAGFLTAAAGAVLYGVKSVAAATSSLAAWAAANAPLAILVGLLTAAGAAAVYAAGGFSKIATAISGSFRGAGQNAVAVFSDIASTATATFEGIYQEITAGNLMGAMDILWAGLKAGWLRGVQAVMGEVDQWVSLFQNTITYMGTNVAIGWEEMWSGLVQGTRTFGALLQGLFDNVINGILAAWDTMEAAVRKSWNWVQSFIKKGYDLAAENERVDSEMAARRQQRQASRPGVGGRMAAAREANEETQRDTQRRTDAMRQNADQIAADRDARNQQRASERAAATHEAEDDLATLLEGAAERAAERASAERIQGGADAARQGMGSGGEVAGTFGAFALGGMGIGQTLQQKILDASLRTADAVEEMAADGPMVAMD